MEPSQHRIVIARPEGKYRDSRRRYRIEVDGRFAGKVGPGEELAVHTTEGTHTVQARIDWAGSPVVSVVTVGHNPARLVVRPAGSAATALFELVGRTRYLKLDLL